MELGWMRMQTDENKVMLDTDSITEAILGCAFRIQNSLGVGFLEKVYENALAHELRKAGYTVEQQYPIQVWYDEVQVGEYVADLLIDHQVIIELKVVRSLDSIHMAQCYNYLKATGKKVCLLVNFGKSRLEYKRILPPSV